MRGQASAICPASPGLARKAYEKEGTASAFNHSEDGVVSQQQKQHAARMGSQRVLTSHLRAVSRKASGQRLEGESNAVSADVVTLCCIQALQQQRKS
ncbi:hypothetical protein MRB53_038414 [Persea americana]|nr:hypothetical protein MRB53_038414 [Persea americana]